MNSLEEAAKLLEEWDTGRGWAWWGSSGAMGCLLCGTSWTIEQPEQHVLGCLVSRTRAWRGAREEENQRTTYIAYTNTTFGDCVEQCDPRREHHERPVT